jgi:hypothetical protein
MDGAASRAGNEEDGTNIARNNGSAKCLVPSA